MAFSGTLQSSNSLFLNPPSSSFSSLTLTPQTHFFPFINPLKFTANCSHNTSSEHLQVDTDVSKKKRKPRPSFHEQIRQKWSVKPISHTKKLPWQLQEQEQKTPSEMVLIQEKVDTVSGFESSNLFAQVSDGVKAEELMFNSGEVVEKQLNNGSRMSRTVSHSLRSSSVDEKIELINTQFDRTDEKCSGNEIDDADADVAEFNRNLGNNMGFNESIQSSGSVEVSGANGRVKEDTGKLSGSKNDVVDSKNSWNDEDNFKTSMRESSADRLPWMVGSDADEGRKRSKTELAEKIIPEHELQRLRNVALRMKERIKVGAAGVTQAVVDAVHEKWQIDEVVKLRFEGPSAFHMKRIHETLESKTGGVVIWRSGSSVVLYRGLTYKLGCVHTYIRERVDSDVLPHGEKNVPDSVGLRKNLSSEELMKMSELNDLLEKLGPRYEDWSGPPPLPVDADLLPGVVPGYKTPFRLLPHQVRRTLKDSETTKFRRQARVMAPHFALGRNRELQGLAAAMVKLWEKSAISKIAIKRGVLNTHNERMAEELKRLTGGTLLSRNKEYIVFYRGNDFLPPPVTESLRERERLTMLQYQEEEEARHHASASISLKSQNRRVPMVAGTLAETAAATSRWGKQPSNEDVKKMLKDSAVARHASLISYLQKKYAIAKGKLKKAEKALEKVHEYLEPEQLPTDLETITDEERLVFRRMGLSMKPHLLLGRREVFAGTVENMHMHWKYRELVKIIVRGKNFAQVKHIAIFLEAESGGLIVSIDKTTRGYIIIIYRGKNYKQPIRLKPGNLLTRRQALARSIELQRREGLKHHIYSLQDQMELVKSELEDLKRGKELDDRTFYEKLDDAFIPSDDDMEEDEDEEAYLQTYDSGDEISV